MTFWITEVVYPSLELVILINTGNTSLGLSICSSIWLTTPFETNWLLIERSNYVNTFNTANHKSSLLWSAGTEHKEIVIIRLSRP